MPGGRKSKYTDEIADKIVEAVRSGLGREDAATLVGIDRRTLTRWMESNESFAQRVYEADSFATQLATSCLQEAIRAGQWKAALAWLQAKRPTEWGLRQRVDIANPPGEVFKSATVDLGALSTAEIQALIELSEKAVTDED